MKSTKSVAIRQPVHNTGCSGEGVQRFVETDGRHNRQRPPKAAANILNKNFCRLIPQIFCLSAVVHLLVSTKSLVWEPKDQPNRIWRRCVFRRKRPGEMMRQLENRRPLEIRFNPEFIGRSLFWQRLTIWMKPHWSPFWQNQKCVKQNVCLKWIHKTVVYRRSPSGPSKQSDTRQVYVAYARLWKSFSIPCMRDPDEVEEVIVNENRQWWRKPGLCPLSLIEKEKEEEQRQSRNRRRCRRSRNRIKQKPPKQRVFICGRFL